jgi:hypothetical protein
MSQETEPLCPPFEVLPPELAGPDVIRANLGAFSIGVESTRPDETQLPQVNLDWPLKRLGRELGQLARGSNLFRRGQQIVTIDERTGETREMPPERLCSYAEEICWPYKLKGSQNPMPAFSRLPRELAALILNSDDFREQAREVVAIYEPALPVWVGEGAGRTIELTAKGYNPATKVFCVNSLDYDRNLDAGEAQEWLLETLGAFPWAEAEKPSQVLLSRSFAAHTAGMLAPFCSLLLGEHSRRPMIPYLANQAASGKTRLAQISLAPVFGEPVAVNADQRPEELEKIISTAALEQRPYLFLDDCGNFKSRALNMLLTSGRISTRIMGQSKMPDVPNRMQIFLTGNGIEIGHELLRRSVIVDLFYPGELAERKFSNPITEEWLFARETRSRFLAVLWSFVRNWRDLHGMKRFPEAKRPSFESFAEIIGSITLAAGLSNPFAERRNVLGGDDEEKALVRLLCLIAGEVMDTENPPEYRPRELADKAEAFGLLDVIIPYAKDQAKALGQRLKLHRGRHYRDTQGRLFEFGRREVSAGAVYPIRFLGDS